MIKVNEVAHVKTTDEPVFILEIMNVDTRLMARVRRPVMGKSGIQHVLDDFYVEELETPEAKRLRNFKEAEDLLDKVSRRAATPGIE